MSCKSFLHVINTVPCQRKYFGLAVSQYQRLLYIHPMFISWAAP
jgi:hypothetical protein